MRQIIYCYGVADWIDWTEQRLTGATALYDALNWLTHVMHGVGKSGVAPDTGEPEDALRAAEDALAAFRQSPSSTPAEPS